MAFSYNPALTTEKDQARFMLQDTNPQKYIFEDTEIAWAVNTEANVYMAAAMLCDTLIQRNAGVRYKKIGDLSIGFDPAFYRTLSGSLRARGSGHQVPYAGGTDVADKTAQAESTNATQPSVFRRLDDNQQALSPEQPPPSNPLTVI